MDHTNIKNIASTLAKTIDDNEKIFLSSFADKLCEVSEAYPEDQTIGQMANIVARMSGSNLFITRAEVKDLYKRLYSRNTKFATLFASELGHVEKLATAKTTNRINDIENLSIVKEAFEKIVDPTLANALDSVFGNPVRGYTDTIANAAKSVCVRACACVKISHNIDVVSGDSDFIVCRASFETPKGMTSVFVPVEVVAGKALIPSVFVGNTGPEDFSKTNLENYIVSNAGKKSIVSDKLVLQAVKSVKNDGVEKISNVDLALIKLNSERDTQADVGGVLYQNVEAEDKNLVISTPQYEDKEVQSFAKAFDTALGVASFSFGKEAVNAGRTMISNKLNSFGMKNHQISVYANDNNSIIYAVSSGQLAFRVPMDIENGKVIEPNVILSSGGIESFSKNGIASLTKSGTSDYATAAAASQFFGGKPSELVQVVRAAVGEGNYAKAEEALNVLSESGDDKAYQTAFAKYTNGLSGKKVIEASGCKMIVRNGSSKHEICGHTGLPTHKVFQDKNGNCQPSYRQAMSDSYEGAYLQNHKILF